MINKLLYLFLFFLFLSTAATAQELNCQVSVITPSIQGTQTRIFETMQTSIREFMNNRRWTKDNFSIEERIECSILVTINEGSATSTNFGGTIQIQSSRAVFNSNFSSPLLNILDNNFSFSYIENAALDYTPEQFRSNLTAVLAYYAYMIIGYDYDSFSPEGGTSYFQLAQGIVGQAQNASEAGWKSFEGDKNRYWLVENILQPQFKPLRASIYQYHRGGMDIMYDKASQARKVIAASLEGLKTVHQAKPLSYNMQSFFLAKNEEIVNIFKPAPPEEKTKVFGVVSKIDVANISKYQVLGAIGAGR
jgi:Domain of unknown function (DUF4835)